MDNFENWFERLKALFDGAGENWKGYAEEMRKSDEGALKEAFEGGITAREMFESELDAAR